MKTQAFVGDGVSLLFKSVALNIFTIKVSSAAPFHILDVSKYLSAKVTVNIKSNECPTSQVHLPRPQHRPVCAQLCLTHCNPVAWGLAMEFSRQQYWNELSFPTPGDLPHFAIESESFGSPALVGEFFTTEPPEKPSMGLLLLLSRFSRFRLCATPWT